MELEVNKNKTVIFAVLIIILIATPVSGQEMMPQELKKRVLSAWEKYIYWPSPENAREIANTIPEKWIGITIDLSEIFYDEDFKILEINMFSGEKEAIGVIYKMKNISDAAQHEMLNYELGYLIRINPRVFLRELVRNRRYVADIAEIIMNYGSFAPDNRAADYERRARIKALESVNEKEFSEIKEECLNVLRK